MGAETLKAPRAEEALDAIATVIREAMGAERRAIFRWDAATGLRLAGESPGTGVAREGSALLSYTVENAAPAAERADGTLTILSDTLLPEGGGALQPTWGYPSSARSEFRSAFVDRSSVPCGLSAEQPFGVTDDQRRVLGALSYYAALGVERLRLAGAEEEAESLRRADRLKDALLAAVSHDLRTPLTAIKGIANEIWRGGDPGRAQTIEEEADRLNAPGQRPAGAVADQRRALRVDGGLNTADDVVGAALERVEAVHGDARSTCTSPTTATFSSGQFDFPHTMRALTNLLENAVKYSPSWARPCRLSVRSVGDRCGSWSRIVVRARAFRDEEKVCSSRSIAARALPDGVRGTGLGLSIARQSIEAQGGTLTYAPRADGGSRFTIELPAVTFEQN